MNAFIECVTVSSCFLCPSIRNSFLSFLWSFINLLRNNISKDRRFLELFYGSSATYVAFLRYWFLRLNIWFSWNLMATFLFLADKRNKGPFNIIHWVIWHTINKATGKLFKFTRSSALIKDSFRKNIVVVELRMIL